MWQDPCLPLVRIGENTRVQVGKDEEKPWEVGTVHWKKPALLTPTFFYNKITNKTIDHCWLHEIHELPTKSQPIPLPCPQQLCPLCSTGTAASKSTAHLDPLSTWIRSETLESCLSFILEINGVIYLFFGWIEIKYEERRT